FLASGGMDHTVRIWDPQAGQELRVLAEHQHFVQGVAFSPGGELVASAGLDRTVRFWDPHTGTLLDHFLTHDNYISVRAFAPGTGKRTLAFGSEDKTVRLWQ